jgi:hypothetical protein
MTRHDHSMTGHDLSMTHHELSMMRHGHLLGDHKRAGKPHAAIVTQHDDPR